MSNQDLAIRFFFQLALILAVIRLVGVVARKLGQPQVVGEMITGVILGPSVFGALLPELQTQVFPKESITIIYTFSQIGLVIYMFLVGTQFNIDIVVDNFRSSIFISLAGIITPFALGSTIAIAAAENNALFPAGVSLWEAILFTGSAMSITAFPMLARIIFERGLTGTTLGTLALAAGSIDDAAAWSLLAVVLASIGNNPLIAVSAIGGGALYAAVVLLAVRPLLRHLEVRAKRDNSVGHSMLGFILMLLMLASWFTDYVGIYAVFGAFILGIAMPRGIINRELQRMLEPIATTFLLPLFFIYSGLNTQLGLVVTPALWSLVIVVIVVACVGKGVACWAAARLSGQDNTNAMAIGTLMNARGLMELILLNIGLQHSIITSTMFTIMVIMAIVTTLLVAPVFEYIYQHARMQALAT